MKISELRLVGAYTVEPEIIEDARGFFARIWDQKELNRLGSNSFIAQCNISYNQTKGTLRGMHFQIAPFAEAKVVRCTMGAIYDVIIDLREDSETYKQWISVELSAENRQSLFIPEGFAHGFQTLVDDSEVFYQMTEFYHPEAARGIRWNDPAFNVKWPISEIVLSDKDNSYPDFVE